MVANANHASDCVTLCQISGSQSSHAAFLKLLDSLRKEEPSKSGFDLGTFVVRILGMFRFRHSRAYLILPFSALVLAASCSLNPQPEPPGYEQKGAGGSMTSGTGGTVGVGGSAAGTAGTSSNGFSGAGGTSGSGTAGFAGSSPSGFGGSSSGSGGSSSGSGGGAGVGGAGGTSGSAGTGGSSGEGGSAGSGNAGTGGSAGASDSHWPDSGTVLCTDGSMSINCPGTSEALYGQDGNYQIAPPVYQVGTESVIDQVTLLEWQKTPASTNNAMEADTYCANLMLASFDDWRLPSRLELVSIIDYGQSAPAVSPNTFEMLLASSNPFATTTMATTMDDRWAVNLESGASLLALNSSPSNALCVRGQPLQRSFQLDMNSETVFESLTQLTWQAKVENQNRTWSEALSYCESLDLAGQSDWRLPSIKELATLISDDPNLLIPKEFGGAIAGHSLWSSTPQASSPNRVWTLAMDTGLTTPEENTLSTFYVLCVR
jgi:hypothetical protein